MRKRAGSVGVTGLLVVDVETTEGGMRRLSRDVQAMFAPSDTARTHVACRKK